MKRLRTHRSAHGDTTLNNRLAAAFASLYLSIPLVGIFWLLFNSNLAVFADATIPGSYFGITVGVLAGISFAFPRFAPSIFGWLWELFIGLVRWC